MPTLSRPALMIYACVFLCALIMLCVTQLSAARGTVADLEPQASFASAQVADASGNTSADAALTQLLVADGGSELSEPMLPPAVVLTAGLAKFRPAGHIAFMLPHPLIEGLQRPPRLLRA